MGNAASGTGDDRKASLGTARGSGGGGGGREVSFAMDMKPLRAANGHWNSSSSSTSFSILRDESTQTEPVRARISGLALSHKRFALYLLAAYGLMIVALCSSSTLQCALVYLHVLRFPLGDLSRLDRFGLFSARNVEFGTADGELLRGYHILPPQSSHSRALQRQHWTDREFNASLAEAQRIVVYFHGNGATRAFAHRVEVAQRLANSLQAHVIAFDYRGFGDSTGSPSETGTQLDALAAVEFVQSVVLSHRPQAAKWRPQPASSKWSFFESMFKSGSPTRNEVPFVNDSSPKLYLYGHSLGSAIATVAARDVNKLLPGALTGLILDAPFASIEEATKSHPGAWLFRIVPAVQRLMSRCLGVAYRTIDIIQEVNVPILLLHGNKDFQISQQNSQLLFNKAIHSGNFWNANFSEQLCHNNSRGRPIQFVKMPNIGHNDVHRSDLWDSSISNFVMSTECVE